MLSLITPENQIIYNTLYFQKLFEHDERYGINLSPHAEYLSRLINLNLNVILDNKSSCILDGVEIIVKSILGSKITFTIIPGTLIIDYFLIEILDEFDFEIDLKNVLNFYVVLYFKLDNKILSIDYVTVDENFNSENWNEKYFPVKLFKFYRNENVVLYSANNFNIPWLDLSTSYDENGLGDFDVITNQNLISSGIYTMMYSKGNEIKSVKSLVPYYSVPTKYTINNIDYIIPNYGKLFNTVIINSEKIFDYYVGMMYNTKQNTPLIDATFFN